MAHGKVTIAVDEYSSNPTQAFTHYNINQSRFQPPHVHMWSDKRRSDVLPPLGLLFILARSLGSSRYGELDVEVASASS
ncbi:Metallophosphoesterase MPPED2 [Liparis tanakae]|uniref:Metallophosphoesterase MPPED2 n=1 Tax=Liparis tanakae TaxID=230148 RepID=A0A4Z2FL16_9TELE|nr:Metallophosphoesterase MPPED2 [Liparis tanakae]